jgi:hypothetical protein
MAALPAPSVGQPLTNMGTLYHKNLFRIIDAANGFAVEFIILKKSES